MTRSPAAVELARVFNLRDLGGLPTTDGLRVRPGRLFRSDSPHRATREDLAALGELGLQLVIDLREQAERERFGVAAAELASRHAHLPVFDVSGGRGTGAGSVQRGMFEAYERDGHAGEYLFMLEHGSATFVGALEALADADNLPALFHCAVGKDRTGVLAALTLTLVGVPEDEVATDYARTHPGISALTSWALENEPDYGGELVEARPHEGPWTTHAMMRRFLELVDRHHGSVHAFLVDAGLPPAVPDRLRELLLVD